MNDIAMERRAFLKAGGALVVGFVLAPSMRVLAEEAPAKSVALDALDSFLAIANDGSVTLYTGKVDLGTGARAAFRQIVAEELDAPVGRIAIIEGDSALTPDQGSTAGSNGIVVGGMQIRQAAATARQALLAMAATSLQFPTTGLTVENGIVRAPDGKTIGYGKLITSGRFNLPIDKAAPLKDPKSYKIVGQAVPRPDLPAKITAQHVYVHDFRLPNMLHARVIRPPALGATLATVDEASISGIAGARVVRIKDFIAVVAESEWNAVRASRQLRVTWTGGGGLSGSEKVFAAMRSGEIDHDEELLKQGDAAAALNRAGTRRFEASYEWPAQSHASMGPSCAVADVKADRATIWSASQGTHRARLVLAKVLGLPNDAVRVIYLDGSGCYGSNGHDDAAAEAALISRAVSRPVRVQWSREEEHGWDPKGPPQLLAFRGALDEAGKIAAWQTEAWLPFNTPNLASRPLLALDAAGIAQPQGLSSGLLQGNAYPNYAIANMQANVHWLKTTPLRPSNLRAPGKVGNCFAVESFVDELAAAAKQDALAFRLRHIADEKGASMLKRAGEKMNWQSRPSPQPANSGATATGRGIAYLHYKNTDNRVALGVEVAVDRRTGKIRVTRAVCVYEVGQIINPDCVMAQTEGNILQTISRTLHEETIFNEAGVTSTDWVSYPILTFPDVPALDIELVGSPEDKPLGVGEAASAPVPAAIGNAVFDATGIRLRRVPFVPARLRALFST